MGVGGARSLDWKQALDRLGSDSDKWGWAARRSVEALMHIDGANHAVSAINEQGSEEWEWGEEDGQAC